MKAAVLETYNNFVWKEVVTPKVKPGEVLIRIKFASICGSDMHIFPGDFHPRTPIPFTPGHEMGGVVEEIGEGVSGFEVGDKVAVDPIIWCGKCPACLRGHYPACTSLKLVGVDLDGGFAEYISVPQHMVFKTASHLPDEHVALVEIYGIGFHANNRAETKDGDSIAIWGAGRVGQVILQAARTKTKSTIFMVDPLDKRLEIAKNHYENVITINPTKENPVEAIKKYTDGKGVDIAFEAIGHAHEFDGVPTPIRACIQSIRGAGKVVVLGLGDDPAPIVFKELIWKEAKIVASRVSHGEFTEVIEHLNAGNLKPEALISKVMHGSQIQQAFELVQNESQNYLKVLLDFSS
ncbi:alcohol dehydrogenase catalytic domain-containing protein [Maribellus comscasis]|uniref:Alcohol dehydrogenase catalytic domain-containing protein n=1 Tax=Maribellus comscasis TaxID=2681766 RepID=A0A6I6JXR7_9BACT|nr:alcohol dehydrogenase catalytic domain-containing protein [Maribellus comscasis]QGY47956.1 alcohol dehydrogenase catalytic domain-containing protein [Maribellus comscasis]